MNQGYMNRQRPRRIIISGGGTGGHIFPAISIANALKAADAATEILFVGATGRMEMELVPAAGYPIRGLPVSGIRRRRIWENFGVLVKLIRSVRMAASIIRDFRPDVVVGVGGYASGPLLWVAGRRGIPILIQEQNSFAGITNRLLAGKAAVICVAYEGMEKYFPAGKIILTGNPVRSIFSDPGSLQAEACSYFGLTPGRPVVLVLGGSQGAGSINGVIDSSAQQIRTTEAEWIWQAGKYYYERVKSVVESENLPNVKVMSFIDRMDLAYAAAGIIVSRAGAGTISELCLVGKPVILVPSPNVAEDHQTRNAMALAGKNAAVMIRDNDVAAGLADEVEKLLKDREEMKLLASNIRKMARPEAAEHIADEVLKLTNR